MLARKWTFPDFHECCPICHGKECAVRIGYYYRNVYSASLKLYLPDLPIVRYKCTRKSIPLVLDLTFSLLPNCLIPYYSPTITTVLTVIKKIDCDESLIDEVIAWLYTQIDTPYFNVDQRQVGRYKKLYIQSIQKIKLFWKQNPDISPHDSPDFSSSWIISYLENYVSPSYKTGPVGFSDYYYQKQGQYYKNASFLFGTAYQFSGKGRY